MTIYQQDKQHSDRIIKMAHMNNTVEIWTKPIDTSKSSKQAKSDQWASRTNSERYTDNLRASPTNFE